MNNSDPAKLDYTKVMDANRQAFLAIGGIRTAIEKNEPSLTGLVQNAFECLGTLASQYIQVRHEERDHVENAYQNAFARALYFSDEYSALQSGQRQAKEIEALLDPHSPEGLFSAIENVPEDFASKEGLDLSKADTAHGLLRYLHQRLIEAAFDARKLKEAYNSTSLDNVYNLTIGKGIFHLVDLDGQIDCPPDSSGEISEKDVLNTAIQPIFKYYKKELPTKGRKEEFYIFLRRDAINAHVQINCHSAEIDIILDGDKSSMRFNYNEFLNANWEARTNYFTKGLQLLGLNTTFSRPYSASYREVRFDQVTANVEQADEESVRAMATELMRLIASSTDINCSWSGGYTENYVTVEDGLKAFFSCKHTNIDDWLRKVERESDSMHGSMAQRVPPLIKEVRDMPPLEKIARERRKKLGIHIDVSDDATKDTTK
jgi:hypothetical protein